MTALSKQNKHTELNNVDVVWNGADKHRPNKFFFHGKQDLHKNCVE